MSGKLVPPVVVPRLRIQRGVLTRSHWIVPLPTGKGSVLRMVRHQDTSDALGVAVGLLKHRKLIGIDRRIFVNSCLDMPARKISTVGSRERSGAKPADGGTLPIAVVDVAMDSRYSGIRKWKPERTPPSCFRYHVTGPSGRR